MSKKVGLVSGASKKVCLTFLAFVLPDKSVQSISELQHQEGNFVTQ